MRKPKIYKANGRWVSVCRCISTNPQKIAHCSWLAALDYALKCAQFQEVDQATIKAIRGSE